MKTQFMQKLALLTITFLSLPSIALPQTFAGTLSGHVTDSSQAMIASATLTLTNQNTGFVYTVNSDETGSYRFLNVTPGVYTLTIEKDGFSKHKIDNISVSVAEQSIYEITLKPGNIKEDMTISGDEVLGRTDTAVLGKIVRQQEIVELPTL